VCTSNTVEENVKKITGMIKEYGKNEKERYEKDK
jgi:hypothetical protein